MFFAQQQDEHHALVAGEKEDPKGPRQKAAATRAG